MASCDNTVLTGQEGLIQFKPLGTTNCVDDYCPFVRAIVFTCRALLITTSAIALNFDPRQDSIWIEGVSDDGGATVVEDGDQYYIIDDGKGVAGDVDNCGNDMEGVPYIVVSAVDGGSGIIWDVSKAGEPVAEGVLSGN